MKDPNLLQLECSESQPRPLDKEPLDEFPGFYHFTSGIESAEILERKFLILLILAARHYLDEGARPYFCFPMNGANEIYMSFISMVSSYLNPEAASQILQDVRLIAKNKSPLIDAEGKQVVEYIYDQPVEVSDEAVVVFVDEIIDKCDTAVNATTQFAGQIPVHVMTLTAKTDTLELLKNMQLETSIMYTFPHDEAGTDSWVTAGGWLDGGKYPDNLNIFDIARIKVKERLCSKFIGFYPSQGIPERDWVVYEAFLDENLREDVTAETLALLTEMEIAYLGNDTGMQFQLMRNWLNGGEADREDLDLAEV